MRKPHREQMLSALRPIPDMARVTWLVRDHRLTDVLLDEQGRQIRSQILLGWSLIGPRMRRNNFFLLRCGLP
jgi:hypothetical protein